MVDAADHDKLEAAKNELIQVISFEKYIINYFQIF